MSGSVVFFLFLLQLVLRPREALRPGVDVEEEERRRSQAHTTTHDFTNRRLGGDDRLGFAWNKR